MPQPKPPALSPTVYHDGTSLFLEFPGKPGFVLKFAFSEAGLHKALKHIPKVGRPLGGRLNWLNAKGGGNIKEEVPGPKPKVARTTQRKREAAKASPGVKAAAASILRRLKIGES